MRARSVALTLLIGALCAGGLVACSVSAEKEKFSDASFVDGCVARLAKDGIITAHRRELCKCAQDKLEAQGLGDRETADPGLANTARTAGRTCAREVLVRKKISDPAFVDMCAARAAKNATLKSRRIEVCKCIQHTLEAKGFGDRSNADMSFVSQSRAAGAACARKVLSGP